MRHQRRREALKRSEIRLRLHRRRRRRSSAMREMNEALESAVELEGNNLAKPPSDPAFQLEGPSDIASVKIRVMER